MAKTAIQLLNEIGKNLRRSTGSTYTTLTQDFNAVFMVQMMNEAKQMVEDRWKWEALKASMTFSSAIGTSTYVLATGGTPNERSYPFRDEHGNLMAWETTATKQFRLREQTRNRVEDLLVNNDSIQAIPNSVAVYQNGTGLTAKFPNLCSEVRTYRVDVIIPQPELTATSTTLLVPWQPVALYATARCMQERGEEFGGDPDTWLEMYNDSISTLLGTQIGFDDMVMERV